MHKQNKKEWILVKTYFTILTSLIVLATTINICFLSITAKAMEPEELVAVEIEPIPTPSPAALGAAVSTVILTEKDTEEVNFTSIRMEEAYGTRTDMIGIKQFMGEYDLHELELLARVVMSEGSLLPYDGKRAIAETVLNRVESDEFPDTISEVVTAPNQFSTNDNGDPNAECYQAVADALTTRMFPEDMFWFQKGEPSYGFECYFDGVHHYSSKTQH